MNTISILRIKSLLISAGYEIETETPGDELLGACFELTNGVSVNYSHEENVWFAAKMLPNGKIYTSAGHPLTGMIISQIEFAQNF